MAAAYVRADGDDTFVVCLNAGDEPTWVEIRVPDVDGRALTPLTPPGWPWASGDPVEVTDGRTRAELPARGARLLHVRR